MPMNTSDYDPVVQENELKASVIVPENNPQIGYGFYQHGLSREISILSNKISDEFVGRLKEHALKNKNIDFRFALAGQITEEYETPFDQAPELGKELGDFLRQQSENFLGQQLPDELYWNAWTNITKPGEYNPVHCHTNCNLSWVLYLDIPEVIRQEYYKPLTTCPSKGLIRFYSSYSSDDLTFNPRTGDFFLFTANHRHSVGAFYTEGVERISLAGNIWW